MGSSDRAGVVAGRIDRPAGTDRAAAEAVRRAEGEIESLCAEILERYEEASLIYRLTERLGTVLGDDAIARLVLDDAARVLGARAGEIWLQKGRVAELSAAVPEAPVTPELERRGPFTALYDGRPWLREPDAGVEAAAAVPLPDPQGDPIGVLILRGRTDGRSYRSGEIKLLTAIAALTSAFLRNARLAEKARQADAKRREDEIARQIHRGLLPHCDPAVPGLEIAGVCRSAETIGGDYFGYLERPDGGFGLVMADVSGHGVAAALYMAAAKGAFQAEARRLSTPSDLLRRANDALAADFSSSDVFATAFFANFAPGGRRFGYANGGHNPPVLVRSDGRVELLDRGGLALGVMPNVLYQEGSKAFGVDDVLLVYTDGVVEARDRERRLYGVGRLERVVTAHRRLRARALVDRVLEDLAEHTANVPYHDDVTLVAVRGVDSRTAGEGGRRD